jgi:type II secretory pathway pseudopilin PulG
MKVFAISATVYSSGLNRERGASFLELIVVIALLGVMGTFIVPSIGSWSAKAKVEADYQSTLAQIEYLKTRVRLVNGTAILKCSNHSILSYQLSTNVQVSNSVLDSNFTAFIVEDPLTQNPNFNIVSGKSNIVSAICNGSRGIFLASAYSGIEGGGSIDIEINYKNDRVNYPAYRILVNQSTSFVQRFIWNQSKGIWSELD